MGDADAKDGPAQQWSAADPLSRAPGTEASKPLEEVRQEGTARSRLCTSRASPTKMPRPADVQLAPRGAATPALDGGPSGFRGRRLSTNEARRNSTATSGQGGGISDSQFRPWTPGFISMMRSVALRIPPRTLVFRNNLQNIAP